MAFAVALWQLIRLHQAFLVSQVSVEIESLPAKPPDDLFKTQLQGPPLALFPTPAPLRLVVSA
eukprot:1146389-Pelagomonas_calceolata.AAC.6